MDMMNMRSYKDLNIQYTSGDLAIDCTSMNSLEGLPQIVTGNFECQGNSITSLVGGPQRVDGHYMCYSNSLTDLVGCASHIGGNIDLNDNRKITSLVGIHKIIKSCNCIRFHSDKIVVGGIGLLLIANLTELWSLPIILEPFKIIRRYLGTGTKGMMECRAELIANGYANYAKL